MIQQKYVKNVSALNDTQKEYFRLLAEYPIVFGIGAAGSGKSYIAACHASQELNKGKVGKIVLCRPVVATEDIGFLPGTFEEKLDPYLKPLFDALEDRYGIKKLKNMLDNKIIEIAPLAFMRGRAEPLSNIIPTPNGNKTMVDLQAGDTVFGSDGKPIKIINVFPQGIKKILKITFNDHSSVRCSEDHLWHVKTINDKRYKKPGRIITAKNMFKDFKNKYGHKKYEIPICSPVEYKSINTPLDPYLLGCLLGDGCLSVGSIMFTTEDLEFIDLLSPLLPNNIKFKQVSKYDYILTHGRRGSTKNELIQLLKKLNLRGLTSINKFIPDIYKYNSFDVRLEILRGLMDTDGSVFLHRSKNSRQQFYSVSKKLASDVKWLIESLGGTAIWRERYFKENDGSKGHNYPGQVVDFILPPNINPFKLSRKAKLYKPCRLKRLIANIEEDGEEECKCISVDAIDSLYLTNNFIVTHNTLNNSIIILDEAQNINIEQMRMLLTRLGRHTKCYITGDLTQSDLKGTNGLKWALERLKDCPIVGITEFTNEDIVRSEAVKILIEYLE